MRHGKILPGDEKILQASRRQQKSAAVKLDSEARVVVRQAILTEAERITHRIEALAVCTNHVHLVAHPCQESIEEIVSRYKNVAMFALREHGRVGRIWTSGFDKRFCFGREDLDRRIEYV